MRLVMVPEVTSVWVSSCPGESWYGAPGAAQCRQDVELPGLQVVLGEREAAGPVEVPGQSAHPAEHLERFHVEVRALPAPRSDQPIDLVLHVDQCNRSLDMKSLGFKSLIGKYLDIELNSGEVLSDGRSVSRTVGTRCGGTGRRPAKHPRGQLLGGRRLREPPVSRRERHLAVRAGQAGDGALGGDRRPGHPSRRPTAD